MSCADVYGTKQKPSTANSNGCHKPMRIRRITLLIFSVALWAEPLFAAQQQGNSSSCLAEYENHNQIDYGPLIVRKIQGAITDPQQAAIPKACVALFTEKEHRLVATTQSDEEGKFSLANIPPGRYRLVTKAEPLCAASVPLRVVNRRNTKKVLHVHMKPHSLDSCSYAELRMEAAKSRPTRIASPSAL
jgi:hypothetical protein